MRGALAVLAAALVSVGGCAAPSPSYPTSHSAGPAAPYRTVGPAAPLPGLSPSALPGWAQEDHLAALLAFRDTCRTGRAQANPEACRAAQEVRAGTRDEARRFFETRFRAEPVENRPAGLGLLTAYFAPEYAARRTPDLRYSAGLRPRPIDLLTVEGGRLDPALAGRQVGAREVDGRLEPYPARADIEASPAQPLAYLPPEDLFFLQIQGSGTLVFPDGSRRKAVYAGDNGRPFVGVARVMRERGLLADNQTSGDAIRAWLAAHRGPEAQAVMNENPRYVFFRLDPDDGRDPLGAAGVSLPAGRAIAVDPLHHPYGELFWLDAQAPALAGSFPVYRRMVTGLDTGGAIKGPVRADLYLGRGAAAGAEAGRVRHQLRMYRLVYRP